MTLIERYCKRVRGGDYKLVEQELLKITPGKKASLQRSIRLHKGLPPEVLQYLRSWPRLPAAMVIDNHYLMGTGGHAKERLSPPWAIAALDILKDEPVKADEFKNRICRCMRKARGAPHILKFPSFAFTEVEFHHLFAAICGLSQAEAWVTAMQKKFGKVADDSPFFQRIAKQLMSASMMNQVYNLLDGQCPLHGTSDANVGIEECRKVYLEMGFLPVSVGGAGPIRVGTCYFPTCQVRVARFYHYSFYFSFFYFFSLFSFSASSSPAPLRRAKGLANPLSQVTKCLATPLRQLRIAVCTAGPQPPGSDRSAQPPTAGPHPPGSDRNAQPPGSDRNVHRWTSSARVRAQCAPLDLNRQNACQNICQIGCQNICLIECQNICQIERQKIC